MNDQLYCVKFEFLSKGEWCEAALLERVGDANRLLILCAEAKVCCRITYVPTGVEKEKSE